ncbi:Cytochrome d ubiquinol oxidase subunit II [Sphingobium indicum BiD32]|uniref:Cytochrome d ubiquinol oxidase subunit II n=1 Tax=Sphingobium indicum BiD32 TaxID=1301087 RepID=N1MMU7_9SPHN|nr:Cytochrome d ubiquinol oxidase subunit II [Sphingobium indicum BiD32]
MLTGIPFRLDSDLRSFYGGTLLGLFHPFSLLAGLLSVADRGGARDPVVRHGRYDGGDDEYGLPRRRCGRSGEAVQPASVRNSGAWLANYSAHPWMVLAPVLGFLGLITALIGIRWKREVLAFGGSTIATIGIISTVGLPMFPFILPS